VAGSQTWAHDLEVSIDDDGITVAGRDGSGASTVGWSAVEAFAPGFTLAFPDGKPATELQVKLADRDLNFLVPAEQLAPDLVAQLVSMAAEKGATERPAAENATGSTYAEKSSTYVPLAAYDASAMVGVGAVDAGPGMVGPAKPEKRAPGNLKVLLVAGVAAAVLVAVVLGVTLGGGASAKSVTSTTTRGRKTTDTSVSSSPTRELPGPPGSVNPKVAINEVLIRGSDLPGWKVGIGASEDSPGQPQADADSTYDPFVPSDSSLLEPSFGVLQQCSSLALSHLQLLTGNYYAGGPPTWNSATYYPSDENLTQQDVTPQLYSIASLVGSVADQQSDLDAMANPGSASCLSSFFSSYLRAVLSQENDTIDGMTVVAKPVTSVPGVETLEFVLTGQLIQSGDVFGFRNTMIFLGAGRLEVMVSGYDSTDQPIPSGTWKVVLANLQHRMTVVASKN
jgi:hypothetical protein